MSSHIVERRTIAHAHTTARTHKDCRHHVRAPPPRPRCADEEKDTTGLKFGMDVATLSLDLGGFSPPVCSWWLGLRPARAGSIEIAQVLRPAMVFPGRISVGRSGPALHDLQWILNEEDLSVALCLPYPLEHSRSGPASRDARFAPRTSRGCIGAVAGRPEGAVELIQLRSAERHLPQPALERQSGLAKLKRDHLAARQGAARILLDQQRTVVGFGRALGVPADVPAKKPAAPISIRYDEGGVETGPRIAARFTRSGGMRAGHLKIVPSQRGAKRDL